MTLLKSGVGSSSHTCNAEISALSVIHTPSPGAICSGSQSGLVQPRLFPLTIRLLLQSNFSPRPGGKGGDGGGRDKGREGGRAKSLAPQLTFYLGFIFGNDLFVFLELSLR